MSRNVERPISGASDADSAERTISTVRTPGIGLSSFDDDLSREIHGLLGIPIDVVDVQGALARVTIAATRDIPFLLSTANLNFLATSLLDSDFRESLLQSDLCTADGMPIVWLARILGVSLRERVAGSDLFEALKSSRYGAQPLAVFFFGGPEGIAAAACKTLNAERTGLVCAGSFYPGFGTIEEMSTNAVLATLNSSGANFLAVALGAKKGQAWLRQNHSRIRIPIRVHLGATIAFQAGTVNRAPSSMRRWGFEWLWRIKEEPQLWLRYLSDGLMLLRLMLTRVIPLILVQRLDRLRWRKSAELSIIKTEDNNTVTLSLNGAALAKNVEKTVPYFRDVATSGKDVVINCINLSLADTRFLGLLLMLNKQLKSRNLSLRLTGVSPRVKRFFRLNEFGFLLSP